jgi:hypothetical protein
MLALDRLCNACVTELGVSGASVALIRDGHDPGVIAASDERASSLVELQFSLGEGPAIDACRTGRPVLEPDLAAASPWPVFTPGAIAAGAASVFALPLQIGAARFGALTLHRDRSGSLGQGVLADALAMAEAASEITLRLQAEVPPGALHEVFHDLVDKRTVVHQATGMVLVQLDVGVEDALVALRARAYANGQSVGEVAADVVARRFRLEQ